MSFPGGIPVSGLMFLRGRGDTPVPHGGTLVPDGRGGGGTQSQTGARGTLVRSGWFTPPISSWAGLDGVPPGQDYPSTRTGWGTLPRQDWIGGTPLPELDGYTPWAGLDWVLVMTEWRYSPCQDWMGHPSEGEQQSV